MTNAVRWLAHAHELNLKPGTPAMATRARGAIVSYWRDPHAASTHPLVQLLESVYANPLKDQPPHHLRLPELTAMATDKKDVPKLRLTDTPNVAQVMYLINQSHEHRRLSQRIRRWWRRTFQPRERAQAASTIAAGAQAVRTRKGIDASGRVVDRPVE